MSRAFGIALVLLLIGGALVLVTSRRAQGRHWTGTSPEAIQELETGLAAEQKYYHPEAMAHYRHALELDPDLTIARLLLVRKMDPRDDEAVRHVEALRTAPLDELTERERFLIEHFLARRGEREEKARRILASYLERHPDDPFALELECDRLWSERKFDEAEACYEAILEREPNWVTAQNRLGYLAMSQGDLVEAEDRFRTYRYLAPDQANPHDSLGELLALRGRYDEAREELEQALEIRPAFCVSYSNLVTTAFYSGEVDLAHDYVRRAVEEGECEEEMVAHLRCRTEDFALYRAERWDALAARGSGECHREALGSPYLLYLAALHTRDEARLDAIEARLDSAEQKGEGSEGFLRSLAGMREMARGDLEAARASFEAADRALDYWGLGAGTLKLVNRLTWVEASRRAGDESEANRLLAEVEALNPALADQYRRGDLPLPPRPDGAGTTR